MFLMLLSPGLYAQGIRDRFVIDKAKPFAYLVFDHIGPRMSEGNAEGTEGLWLRVVNNCRIPIVFRASGGAGDVGSTFEDEVVPSEPIMQIFSTQEEADAIDREERDRTEALKHKPHGYEFEVSGVLRVAPGTDALFSVPLNHVGRFWFMRVKFGLDVASWSASTGPFTYLDFHDYQIPKKN
jgi:hypothetical protein